MKVIVTHHAADFLRPKWGLPARLFLRAGEWMAARFADRIICVSGTLKAEFLARHPLAGRRTVTIRHGIAPPPRPRSADILRSLGLEPGRYMIAVGRIDETKRLEDLFAAYRRAGSTAQPLVVVGSGNANSAYENGLKAAAGAGVRFVGFREGDELAALYDGASILLHPSEMEGFGLVILEALNAGVKVYASDIPVHREFGLPDECYFPVGDIGRIAAIMATAGPRPAPWPPALAIAARDRASDAVCAHAALFTELLRQPSGQDGQLSATASNVAQ